MRYVLTMLIMAILAGNSLGASDTLEAASISWLSILPPLITIVLALVLREVLVSLAVGIFVGLVIISFPSSGTFAVGTGFLEVPILIKSALFNADHLSVILFTLFIGAMVSVISKNGGMMALVKLISSKVRNARSAQLASWGLGLAIFFDDYANTLVVGKTMRPLTDKMKISREKLAYIVDSTAAPVASIAFITTWIGAELGYIEDGLNAIPNGSELIGNAYSVFFTSLQYSFYPIFTIVFMFLLIWKGRDFGPMLTAERKARLQTVDNTRSQELGEVDDIETEHEHLLSALLPILVLLGGAIGGLLYTGYSVEGWNSNLGFLTNLANLVGAGDAYNSLIWASFSGLTVAIGITVIRGIQPLLKVMDHAIDGVKLMLPAVMILTLAWTLSEVTLQLHTAQYLSSLAEGWLSPNIIPVIVFVLAALIAFATGTSWGTMSILYPIVLLTSWQLCVQAGLSVELSVGIFSATVASVLAGAVLGDHCSPISDTTILSSLATECDHIAHVRTQLPYALTVGLVSIIFGILPAGFGWPWYVTFPISLLTLYIIVSFLGKMVEDVR